MCFHLLSNRMGDLMSAGTDAGFHTIDTSRLINVASINSRYKYNISKVRTSFGNVNHNHGRKIKSCLYLPLLG